MQQHLNASTGHGVAQLRRTMCSVLIGVLVWGGMLISTIWGQTPRSREITQSRTSAAATPLQDDATLHAVTFVGSKFGCAVGDRGTCWITRDGGQNWTFSPTPVQCALRGVHFLTDRLGWAVGGEVTPYTRYATGVVIQTTDGGQSWEVLSRNTTPPLTQVRFLDQELGMAVGGASPNCSTGVLATGDGGKTWTPTAGPLASGWQAAAILPGGAGVVAGARGELGILGEGQLLRTVDTLKGLRGLNAVSIGPEATGWLVGDGGWVLRTKNNGTSWAPPEGEIPTSLRDCVDFQAVAQVGDQVWITGSPGSVIWHSEDGGGRWKTQSTGQSTPLRALCFTDDQHGVAVGDLGKILVTEDGGATWTAVRGGGRRLALLMIHADSKQVSFSIAAHYAGEWGYRAGEVVLTRRDLGTDAQRYAPVQTRLEDAFSVVGGSSATVDWRLPITVPSLENDRDKLIDEWLLLTDQNLPDVVTTDLVAKIRMWQPEVILISTPNDKSATSKIVWDVVQEAVKSAANPKKYPHLESMVGLLPWPVKKVFSHTPGERGTETISAQGYLARAGVTIDQWAEPAAARLLDRNEVAIRDEGLSLVFSRAPDLKDAEQSVFGGLDIPTGGPARRTLSPVSLEDMEVRRNAIKNRVNYTHSAEKQMDSRSQGAELIAHLQETAQHLPADQGAKLLSDIVLGYRQRMLWDSAEQSSTLLLNLYPDHPAATESALWLLRFWTSSEMGWQRLRTRVSRQKTTQINPTIAQAQFEAQLKQNQRLPGGLALPEVEQTPAAFETVEGAVRVKPKDFSALMKDDMSGSDLLTMQSEQWRTHATKVANLMEQASPGFFQEPDVQMSLVALLRRGSKHSDADRVIDQLLKLNSSDPWHMVALGETWTRRPQVRSPRPVVICRKTALAPRLDGKLTDACWVGAAEIQLSDQPPQGGDTEFVGTKEQSGKPGLQIIGSQAMVMVLYDDRFLYVAGSMPRMEGQSKDPPQTAGRTHDSDLSRFDRLSFQFDVDRDYNTFYRFDVDQRGATAESCWDAVGWNPKWYVAPYGDDLCWRFEAAIPWEELVPSPPTSGTFWAAGVTRVIPTRGLQGWNHPLSETPSPQSFGLLRFE